jgi:hypothetical protein
MSLVDVRDIAILLLAVESVVIGALLALMLIQLRRLVRLLRDEIAPILDSASDTVNTVQTTAGFVTHNVVTPLIKVSSYSAGTLQALRSLLFIGRKIGGRVSDDAGDGSLGIS